MVRIVRPRLEVPPISVRTHLPNPRQVSTSPAYDFIRLLTGPVVDHDPSAPDEVGGAAAGDGYIYGRVVQ